MDINMENILRIIGTIITLASFFFGILQWKERIKVEELWLSEMRNLWDIARSYSLDVSKVNSFFSKDTDINKVINRLTKMNTALNIIIRNSAPMYVRLMGENMNYKTIRCMIISNEISSVYVLRIILQNLSSKKRNQEDEEKLFELLVSSTDRVQQTISSIKKAKHKGIKERDMIYSNDKLDD